MSGRVDSEDKTMTTIKTFIHKFNTRILCLTLLSSVTAAAPLIAADGAATQEAEQAHAGHAQAAPAKLVQLVRDATKQFADVNAATAAGYQPFLGCVSGPDHGAMGNHYVNGALVGDGLLDASRPEVLIYEAVGRRSATGRRGVRCDRRHLAGESHQSAGARGAIVPVR